MYIYIVFINSEPSAPRNPCIIGESRDGIVLINWIPPREPNGDVYFRIEYNDGNRTVLVNTSSGSTYFNLTGLQKEVTYNITVVAVNSAGMSDPGPVLNYTYNPHSKYLSICDILNYEWSYACICTITLILIVFTQHPLHSLLPLLPQVSLSRPLTCLKYSIMHICYGYSRSMCNKELLPHK